MLRPSSTYPHSRSRSGESVGRRRIRSLWVFHLNTGACNGCDIEILDVLTPFYDVERFGIKLVGSPRHADALLVTGPLTRQTYYAVKKVYEAMPPEPRIVVAVGTCACSGGIFYDSYAVHGGVDKLLPVHMYIPGCPPRPEEIIFGIAQLLQLVKKKVSRKVVVVKEPRAEERPCERLWLDLREELRKVVGYFDRDRLLEEFMDMVLEAYRRISPLRKLENLVEDYCRRTDDPRLCFCMRFLYAKFRDLVEHYSREHYPLEEVLREVSWRKRRGEY